MNPDEKGIQIKYVFSIWPRKSVLNNTNDIFLRHKIENSDNNLAV